MRFQYALLSGGLIVESLQEKMDLNTENANYHSSLQLVIIFCNILDFLSVDYLHTRLCLIWYLNQGHIQSAASFSNSLKG